MPPIILVGGSLIRKLPEVSPSAWEHGRANQAARADVASSVAGHLQARWCGIESSLPRLDE
jgi:hypothetical protein